MKPTKENMEKAKVKAKLKKGVLVCHQDLKMKETKTAKVKAKPKEGDLFYLQIRGIEVFHQVLRTKEKEMAK